MATDKTKKLYRVRDGIIAGVCGGLADYLRVDPLVIRLLTPDKDPTDADPLFPYFFLFHSWQLSSSYSSAGFRSGYTSSSG